MFKVGKINIEKALLLAPMEDVTDIAYRKFCKELGGKTTGDYNAGTMVMEFPDGTKIYDTNSNGTLEAEDFNFNEAINTVKNDIKATNNVNANDVTANNVNNAVTKDTNKLATNNNADNPLAKDTNKLLADKTPQQLAAIEITYGQLYGSPDALRKDLRSLNLTNKKGSMVKLPVSFRQQCVPIATVGQDVYWYSRRNRCCRTA